MTTLREYPEGSPFPGVAGRTAADSAEAWPAPVRAREGAPNVVLVVLDDVGFAQLGCYGSDIDTPNLDALAAGGLRYRNFHTTAMCSPTRACLLTGRNHHTTGMGGITDLALGYPGYHARMDVSSAMLSEMLVPHGYATFAVGKWHLAPGEELDLGAPRRRWPLGRGFERFYGFLGAETSQYSPDLAYDNHFVEPPARPEDGYHLTEDLVDRAIEFVRDLKAVVPEKPFLLYLCPGACHAPHQVPSEWADRYAGRFDEGWDVWRERTHARQLALGIVPEGTELSERPPWVQAWSDCPPDEQRLYARMMEVFAGFLSHTDHHLGRLVQFLDALGQLDNTLLMVVSDNGASAEGGRHGSFNENLFFNGVPDEVAENLARIDDLGGPGSYGHYPYGWALAGNTPFKRWKRETHQGGTTDPLIVHWPAGIGDRGEVRGQYTHAIDVVPTVLEVLGIEAPASVAGVAQTPIAGTSFAASLAAADAPDRHVTQYYEMHSCRALYHQGYKAVAYHPMFGVNYTGDDPARSFDEDRWELYHVAEDFSECHDLAAVMPDKLRELQDLWWAEAARHGALPLVNLRAPFFARPRLARPRDRYVYWPGAPVPEAAAVDVKGRPHSVTARVSVPPGGAEGVLLAHGGRFGGYALYVRDARLVYEYNFLGLERTVIRSETAVPEGDVELGFEFTPEAGGAGTGRLRVGGAPAGEGRIPRTIPFAYSLVGDGLCCGWDGGTPVGDYESPYRFTGAIAEVVVEVGGKPTRDPVRAAERAWRTQ